MKKILIVDDEPVGREYLRQVLTKAGYEITEASDGEEALALLQESLPDLVITDLLMPVMDGFELLHRIRSSPETADMRVILWSALVSELSSQSLAKLAGASLLSKRLDANALLANVEACLTEAPPHVSSSVTAKGVEAVRRHLLGKKIKEINARLKDEISERLLAERLLNESNQRLEDIVNAAMDAVISTDGEQRITLFNPAAEAMFRRPASEVIGKPLACLLPQRFRDGHQRYVNAFLGGSSNSQRVGILQTLHGMRPDGEEFPIEASMSKTKSDGTVQITVIVRDISEREARDQALRASEARLRRFYDSGLVGVIYWNTDGSVTDANDKFLSLVGYSRADLEAGRIDWQAMTPLEFRHKDEAAIAELMKTGVNAEPIEKAYVRKDGQRVPVLAAAAMLDEDKTHGVAFVLDISELKEAQERIRTAALHDPLTDLPNRALTFEYGRHMLATADRTHGYAALLFIDLDRFKPINDTLGHEAGDAVLKEVGSRLSRCTRQADLVGRLGGDEFVVILTEHAHRERVVAEHVIEAIRQPIPYGEHQLEVTPSIGISLYPDHGRDIKALLRAADLAMYQAKQSGRANYRIYTHDLMDHAAEVLAMEARLRDALAHDGFELHYQPIIDLANGNLSGAEALVRLRNDHAALVGPGEFIAVAEATGLIDDIGAWVATEACQRLKEWQQMNLAPLSIAINVSPLQFRGKGFAERIGRIVADSGIDPTWLHLEITESTVIDNVDNAIEVLADIRRQGIRIALDDFGTGYSSLSLIGRLPLDKLKIDQSFVRRMETELTSLAITQAIIAMGRNLDLTLVAEGVESASSLEHLRNWGCQQAQGFLISRPLPAAEFVRWRQQAH